MGLGNVKAAPHLSSTMDITETIVSKQRAGDIFVLVQGMQSASKKQNGEETTTDASTSPVYHYSVVIDLQGATNDNAIAGYELGLTLDRDTCGTTVFQPRDIRHNRNRYTDIIYVGKYRVKADCFAPITAAKFHLHTIGGESYEALAQANSGLHWSAKLNCHQLSRTIIGKLEMQWPQNLNVVGDEMCLPVDSLIVGKCCLDYKQRLLRTIKWIFVVCDHYVHNKSSGTSSQISSWKSLSQLIVLGISQLLVCRSSSDSLWRNKWNDWLVAFGRNAGRTTRLQRKQTWQSSAFFNRKIFDELNILFLLSNRCWTLILRSSTCS